MIILIGSVLLLVIIGKWWRWIKPVCLSSVWEHKTLIAELAEMIIPRTDTPGAKDSKVAEFVLEMVEHGLSSAEQKTFARGIKAVDAYSIRHFQRGFVQCAENERREALVHFEQGERWMNSIYLLRKIRYKLFGRPFFQLLKELIVIGYCTSEVGCNRGLAYDYIPMYYESCVVLKQGQKSWATV